MPSHGRAPGGHAMQDQQEDLLGKGILQQHPGPRVRGSGRLQPFKGAIKPKLFQVLQRPQAPSTGHHWLQ
eukprot:5829343-Lingulodinium_polyedra.AAC.1